MDLKIYVDGKLDRKATYTPIVKKRLAAIGWSLNDWIVDLQKR